MKNKRRQPSPTIDPREVIVLCTTWPVTQKTDTGLTPLDDLTKRLQLLLEQQLAACVQIGPPVRSVYTWENTIVTDEEYPLCIKTVYARLPALQDWLSHHHPYTVPEILVYYPDETSVAYANWLVHTLQPHSKTEQPK